jgi:hypothetical protein
MDVYRSDIDDSVKRPSYGAIARTSVYLAISTPIHGMSGDERLGRTVAPWTKTVAYVLLWHEAELRSAYGGLAHPWAISRVSCGGGVYRRGPRATIV